MHELWRHYKGGTYKVITVAIDEETMVPVVVYQSIESGAIWTRPVYDFFAPVDSEQPIRFCPIVEA